MVDGRSGDLLLFARAVPGQDIGGDTRMFDFIVIRADRDSGLFGGKDLFLALPLMMLTSMVVYAIPHTAEVTPTARLLA